MMINSKMVTNCSVLLKPRQVRDKLIQVTVLITPVEGNHRPPPSPRGATQTILTNTV